MNQITNAYIREVKRELCCPLSLKIAFVKELKRLIRALPNKDEITFELLCQTFGTPVEIASGFSDRADIPRLKKKSVLYRTLFIIAIILLIAVAAFTIWFMMQLEPTNTSVTGPTVFM